MKFCEVKLSEKRKQKESTENKYRDENSFCQMEVDQKLTNSNKVSPTDSTQMNKRESRRTVSYCIKLVHLI